MSQENADEPVTELTNLLFDKWDPIGVKPLGAPRNHYARYARGVIDVWIATQDESEVLAYFRKAYKKCLGEDEALDGPSVSVAKYASAILRSHDWGQLSPKGF